MLHIIFRVAIALFTPTGDADADADELQRGVSESIHRIYEGWSLHDAARKLPDVASLRLVDQFVDVALELQTQRVPAALLVALAWGESRFDASAQPACGVMQVYPRDLDEPATSCAEWRRDLHAGVRAGVREIEMMLADKRVSGNMRRALLYRACGNKAFDGSCEAKKYAWVTAAMDRWRALSTKKRPVVRVAT